MPSDKKILKKKVQNKNLSVDPQKNLGFATNSNFLIPIFVQLDGVDLCYFKLRLLDLT